MGQAYTPGLKVSKYTLIQKERILPIKGKTLVKKGDMVTSKDVVATAQLPGSVIMVKVANKLGVLAGEMEQFLQIKEGDQITTGQIIAEKRSFLGLMKDIVKSPIEGIVESISSITGQCVLRLNPTPIDILAYVSGEVKKVYEDEGVLIETKGAFMQGIFGIGGEVMGDLHVMVKEPSRRANVDDLSEEHIGKIIVVGSHVDYHFIKRAVEVGVKGIITAGIDDADVKALLGYEIGVAITGNEDISLSIVVTEGFGKIDMAHKTFELLQSLDGKYASMNGATQIRAGVIRPEVIVTDIDYKDGEIKESEYFIKIGKSIRIIRNPYFGKIATVIEMPTELHELESGAMVRVVRLELEDGEKVIVPRANVEIIEE
ncbi:hypothetical protein KAU32_11880 [bacterium]|nr:hypothetical protein [bacterium]